MDCKCTQIQYCNPCTNTTRYLDMCPECLFAGHANLQSKNVITSNIKFRKK